uniref:IBB domain-containing protein n=1 Tax=Panagrolaimus sp. ES5 TaxID=591445 RepID=A0AC34FMW5_9BILA
MADHRSQICKNVGKADEEDSRKQRAEINVQLRREKRENKMNKRRNIGEATKKEAKTPQCNTFAGARKILSANPSIAEMRIVFPFLLKEVSTSKKCKTIVDKIVQEGLLESLVQGLNVKDFGVQKYAALVLHYFLRDERPHIQNIVSNSGAFKALIEAAHDDNEVSTEICLLEISFTVGYRDKLRDEAIEYGVFDLIKDYLYTKNDGMEVGFFKHIAFLCEQLCIHKENQLTFEQIEDDLTFGHLYKAVSNITDGKNAEKQIHNKVLDMVIKADILQHVFQSFISMDTDFYRFAVEIFYNFTCGNFECVQHIIDLKILNPEILFWDESLETIKVELSMLSNVAGTHAHIQNVIDAKVIPKIIHHIQESFYLIQDEATSFLSKLCEFGSQKQICYLASFNIFPIVPYMDIINSDSLVKILSVINCIFYAVAAQHPEHFEKCENDFRQNGGINKLKELRNDENFAISELCIEILDTYFADEDD